MRCGKTTALGVLKRLVCRALQAANISAAAVFRTVEAMQPTLLVDEADTFLGKHDDLRGIINSGHSKDGTVVKVDGDDNEPRIFATFAATAIAAIGHLPGTIEDRSIIIQMKRKKASERVMRLRGDRAPDLDDLARQCRRWIADNNIALAATDAEPPAILSDRAADGWRPLICIADRAGGDWPDLARHASIALSAAVDDEESIRVMLLKDIQTIFAARGVERLPSEAIVEDLYEMEDRPWLEYGKERKPITKTMLAKLLKPFKITPGNIKMKSGSVPKGYHFEQFQDAFERYLTVPTVPVGETPPFEGATCYRPQETAGNGHIETATGKVGVAVSNAPRPAGN
jgi:putative DNA primase/helicase